MPLVEETISLCQKIPQAAKEYYGAVEAGNPLMYFLNVPHVFYEGHLDLANEEIRRIEV